MVAYNLMLAIFPFAFLVLFIFSQVLRVEDQNRPGHHQRPSAASSPNAEQGTLDDILKGDPQQLRHPGVAAVSARSGSAPRSGAMDTAFCRIYHVQCRGWWEQKRFSLVMLLVVTIFLLGSVPPPSPRGCPDPSDRQPSLRPEWGPEPGQRGIARGHTQPELHGRGSDLLGGAEGPHALAGGLAGSPSRPWSPPLRTGSSRSTSTTSTLNRFGSTIGFILIARFLVFYLVALTMLAGAVINSIRHEYHDTGACPTASLSRAQLLARAQADEAKAAQRPMAEPYRSLVSGDAWPKPEAGPDEESEAETKVIPLRRRKRQ